MKKASLVWIAICAGLLVPIAYTALSQAQQKPPEPKNVSTSEESPIAGLLLHGKVKDGLAAFLLCHRDRFKIGEPIPLNYGIINVGPGADVEHSHNVRIWFFATRPWDPKNFVWLEVTGPDGKNIRYHGGAIEWRAKHPVDKNSVFLRHRQFIGTFFPDLRETFELNKPGTYKVRLGYNPWFEDGPWTGELMSNEVQFEIVK